MIFKPGNTLFNTTLKVWDIPNTELRRTYEGIVEFKDTGLMPKYLVKIFDAYGDKIRKVTQTKDTWYRDIEDILLFEMARRYYNKEI